MRKSISQILYILTYLGVMLMVVLVPIERMFMAHGYAPIGLIGRITAVLWIIYMIIARGKHIERVINIPTLFVFLWVLWGMASFLWAQDQAQAVNTSFKLIQLVGYFIILQYFLGDKKLMNKTVLVLFAVTSLAAVYSIIIWHGQGLPRAILSHMQNPNEYGRNLGIALLLFPIVNNLANSTFKKGLANAGAISIGTALFLTSSRGAWIGLAFSIFMVLIRYAKAIHLKEAAIVFLGAALCMILVVEVGNNYYGKDVLQTRLLGTLDSDGAGRADIWKVGLELAKNNMFFGVGLGGFSRAFPNYIPYTDVDMDLDVQWSAHNIYLSLWGELGLIGLAIFLCMAGYVLIKQSKCGYSKNTMAGLLILLFLLGSGFFKGMLYAKYFWFALAFVVATNKQKEDSNSYRINNRSLQKRGNIIG